MDETKVQEMIDAATKPLAEKHEAFSADINAALGIETDGDAVKAIAALKAGKDASELTVAEHIKADFEAKIDGVLVKAKADGKLLPANEPVIRAMVDGWKATADESGKASFELGEKKIEGTVPECLEKFFEAQTPIVNLAGELGGNGLNRERNFTAIPGDVQRNRGTNELPMNVVGGEQAAEVEAYRLKNKCDYMTAFAACTGGYIPAEPSPESGASYSFNEQTGEMIREG